MDKATADERTNLLPDTLDPQTLSLNLEDEFNRKNSGLEEEYYKHNLDLPKLPIVFSLWMGSFLGALDGTIVANIMNRVAEEFQESDKKQWIATSFLLTNTAFQPLYGKLSDITGRKFALLVAHTFFCLGCLLTCFARNVTEFSVARAICGIGGGGISAMSSITVSDICTARERGAYQGYANVVFSTGQLLGAPLGGFALDRIGWRAIFGLQVPMLLICMVLGYRNVNIKLAHVPPLEERFTWKNLSRIDIGGSITLVSTISGVLFLCSTSLNKAILSVFTGLSFMLFMYNELYLARERILPFELLGGSFGLASILTVGSSFVIFGDVFRSPIFLQLVQNISVTKTGGFLLFSSIATAAASLITGWILRNTKMNLAKCSYLIVFFSIFLQLCGLVIAVTLLSYLEPNQTSLMANNTGFKRDYLFKSDSLTWKCVYICASAFTGYGYASLLVSTLVSIVFTIDKSQQATITGLFYLWRSIGNVLGASLTLSLYEATLSKKLWSYLSANDITEQYNNLSRDSSYLRKNFSGELLSGLLDVYNSSFIVSYVPSVGICVCGIVLAWALIKLCRTL